jgi:outer membrane protein assembly factor BamB
MMPMCRRPAAAAALLLACVGFAGAPSAEGRRAAPVSSLPHGFRGDGSGRYPDARPPTEWSGTKNILWSTKIGPNKYSSPVVVEGRIFLVAEPALLFCVDAADGRILWQRSNGFADLGGDVQGKPPRGDAGNTTPTPVCDGHFVYAVFGSGIVACYDVKGERRWIRYEGPCPAPEYGRSASPVLAGDKLLVTLSCLVALDANNGLPLWKNKDVVEQYGSAVVATLGGVDVAILPSGQIVRISDGAILASDLGGLRYASPIVQDGAVYLIQAGSSAQNLVAASTDKWEAKTAWEQELEGTFYASPVCDKGLIYAVSNEGNFYILDSKDGKILARQELAFTTAGANMYPSLALAGNRLFVLNDQGDAIVLAPGREYRELHRNHLPDGHGGAPVFDGERLYLRAGQFLHCIAEGQGRSSQPQR